MYQAELRSALYHATELVTELLDGRVGVEVFAEAYGTFFYFEALDGHEADAIQEAVLKKFEKAVSFHERVQTEVVDLLYLGEEDKEQYFANGRIGSDEAMERLTRLAYQYSVCDLLQELHG